MTHQHSQPTTKTIEPIATMHSLFPEKFGIPRQGTLIASLPGKLVLTNAYQKPGILRGLSQYSHIWIIWGFHENEGWSPTVRPPRLGGNERMGVFATRSPFRPNGLGMSAMRIHSINEEQYTIDVLGCDLVDGTPIYDIKPYIPYSDALEAQGGMSQDPVLTLTLLDPTQQLQKVDPTLLPVLKDILQYDPRPAYHDDPTRVYNMKFATYDIHFRVQHAQIELVGIDVLSHPTS